MARRRGTASRGTDTPRRNRSGFAPPPAFRFARGGVDDGPKQPRPAPEAHSRAGLKPVTLVKAVGGRETYEHLVRADPLSFRERGR